MVDAGNRYAKIEGIDNPGTISYDEILDTVGVDEYQNMFTAIVEAVKAGNTPTIKTTPAKRKTKPPSRTNNRWVVYLVRVKDGIDEERNLVNPVLVSA